MTVFSTTPRSSAPLNYCLLPTAYCLLPTAYPNKKTYSANPKYGALACVIAGTGTRLIFFVLMQKMFGSNNTLLYIKNTVFTADFDGFPTLIAPLVGLVVFIAVSLLTNNGKKFASD